MTTNTFVLENSTPHKLIYSWDDEAGPGTLTLATLLSDAVAGPLKDKLTALDGECNSDPKATAALLTGATFTGAISAGPITSKIQSRVVITAFTAGKAPPALTCVDSGGGNDPLLTLTSDTAAGTGLLIIEHGGATY